MKGHPVELRAEFHQFEPFRIVSSVFSCCIARDSRAAFFSSSLCSSFGALECDNDKEPLLLAIMTQCISGSKQLD